MVAVPVMHFPCSRLVMNQLMTTDNTYTTLAETSTTEAIAASKAGKFKAAICREGTGSQSRPVKAILLILIALVGRPSWARVGLLCVPVLNDSQRHSITSSRALGRTRVRAWAVARRETKVTIVPFILKSSCQRTTREQGMIKPQKPAPSGGSSISMNRMGTQK